MNIEELYEYRGITHIPDHPKYAIFRDYISNSSNSSNTSNTSNTSNKTQQLPTYLINKYSIGNQMKTKHNLSNKDIIKNILSKISESNKNEFFNELNNLKINNNEYDEIISLIITYSIDLEYMNDLYVDLIKYIFINNKDLFKNLYIKLINFTP